MSIAARDWAWNQDLPPVTKIVLLALAERADDSGVCWPSLNSIAKHCRISRPTVCSHLDKLAAVGLIAREKRERDDGSQTSTRYQLTLSKYDTPLLRDLTDLLSTETPLLSGVNRPVKTALQRTEPSVTVTEPSPSLTFPSVTPETRAAKIGRAKKPERSIEDVTIDLIAEYADLWGESEVRRRVDTALNHKASTKWLNKERGIKDWLRRDAEQQRKTAATGGVQRNERPAGARAREPDPYDRFD